VAGLRDCRRWRHSWRDSEKKEERKEEEEIFDRTVISPKGVNLGDVLLCPKDVSEDGTLSSTVTQSRYHVHTLGHH
jgi:hypothetical protein